MRIWDGVGRLRGIFVLLQSQLFLKVKCQLEVNSICRELQRLQMTACWPNMTMLPSFTLCTQCGLQNQTQLRSGPLQKKSVDPTSLHYRSINVVINIFLENCLIRLFSHLLAKRSYIVLFVIVSNISLYISLFFVSNTVSCCDFLCSCWIFLDVYQP